MYILRQTIWEYNKDRTYRFGCPVFFGCLCLTLFVAYALYGWRMRLTDVLLLQLMHILLTKFTALCKLTVLELAKAVQGTT